MSKNGIHTIYVKGLNISMVMVCEIAIVVVILFFLLLCFGTRGRFTDFVDENGNPVTRYKAPELRKIRAAKMCVFFPYRIKEAE